jgi:hypothetical protein
MSVVSSQAKFLFCEGKPDSLDYAILKRLMVNPNTLIPAGGKRGLGAFIQGRFSNYRENNQPAYIAFRDRDFDAQPPVNIQLIQLFSNKPVFLSHRACIENYLLDASLIHAYWTEGIRGPRWGYGEPPDLNHIDEWIKQSAKDISDYQAVRWALAQLKPKERWPEIGTTWTKGSGSLPNSLQLEDCVEQAKQLIATFKDIIIGVGEVQFEQHLNHYRDKFVQTEFWEKEQYLVWFHGKDLKKAMPKNKPGTISLKHFFNWATEHLELTKHPDLLELEKKFDDKVNQFKGLPRQSTTSFRIKRIGIHHKSC